MCIVKVFCQLALKVQLLQENSVLHRNSHYVIFPQDEYAMVTQSSISWPWRWSKNENSKATMAVMVDNAAKMLLSIAGKFIKNANHFIKDKV